MSCRKEWIDSLGEPTSFVSLDANSGYRQVGIEKPDRDMTGFLSHYGLFCFIRMPLDRYNEHGACQLTMNVILYAFKWQFAFVFLEKMWSSEANQRNTSLMYEKLSRFSARQEWGLDSKIVHCYRTGSLLRTHHSPKADQNSVSYNRSITETSISKNVAELSQFLGCCNVFNRSVPSCARFAAPLSKRLWKDLPPALETLCEEALQYVQSLKGALISYHAHSLPNSNGHRTHHTIARDVNVGSVLIQE